MFGGMLASMIESIGDYFACARLAGAPPPTPGIISRGLGCEGIGILISGLVGTSNATTSYSENIGAIAVTGVGSRVVVQCGAVIIIIVSMIAKVGALFATMPGAMTSGLYCALFGLIVAVGLSNLQYVDLNSPRNQFIIGFALFNSLSIAGPSGYFASQNDNPFGDSQFSEILLAIFSSPMIIAFMAAFFMDNTIPGTREERGLHIWDQIKVSCFQPLVVVRLSFRSKSHCNSFIYCTAPRYQQRRRVRRSLFASYWIGQGLPQLFLLGVSDIGSLSRPTCQWICFQWRRFGRVVLPSLG